MKGVFAAFKSAKVAKSLNHNPGEADTTPEHWHAQYADTCLTTLAATPQGLAANEVAERRAKYGPNRLPEPETRGPLLRFLAQFHNVLIYVLLAACGVTLLLQHWVDASVILAVVFLNALIGFIQEGKAEDALKAIRHMLSPNARVMRAGRQTTIAADELVPGDIVLLQSGDKVPADLRLVRVKGLQIQEAILTGESLAVEKHIDAGAQAAVIGDRRCMAYSGTLVTHGQGSGVVVATAAQTEIGRISRMVSEVESVTTPLLRHMDDFGRKLTYAILAISVFTFAYGSMVRDYAVSEMFLAAVSLAVAAIPEGLPAIMTITLALGVQRMARRNAIIRRLPAVDTLGAVSVICSDKTGTLTRNEMTVRTIAMADHVFQLSGTGYDTNGTITLANKEAVADEEHRLLQGLLQAGVLCNDASLEQGENEWRVNGDPMEGALLIAAMKAGLDLDAENAARPRTDLIPFESEHCFMATLHYRNSESEDGCIFLKGAPERVLDMCTQQRTLGADQPLERDYWLQQIEQIAAQGQRVLAIAAICSICCSQ